MKLAHDYSGDFVPQLKKSIWVVVAVLGIVWLRLYYLQLFKGDYYRFFSEENSIHQEIIPALRGMVFDRNGNVLVDNRPAFDVVVIPQYVVNPKKMMKTLEEMFGFSQEFLEKKWEVSRTQAKYIPIVLAKDVSQDVVAKLRARKSPWDPLIPEEDLRGVEAKVRYQREYPSGKKNVTHLLGYTREIDPDRLQKYHEKNPGRYHRGDSIGIAGLEEVWDLDLRGEDGYNEKVVDAVGREVDAAGLASELTQKNPTHGKHLHLTIDAKLQKVAEEAFLGKSGAAVALEPDTGKVLLFYSAPSYDLGRLQGADGSDYFREISTSPEKYLLNRVVQGTYPPGSTYKMVLAAAALSEKKVKLSDSFFCPGYYTFGGRAFRCWRHEGHGPVDFIRALVQSCDVFFYQMGHRVGVDNIARYARFFGLGEKTGIALPEEKQGLIPTKAWKEKVFKAPWMPGENLSIAIGQGYDLVTPLQSALMVSVVSNGGKRVRPYLVEKIVDPKTEAEELILPTPPPTIDGAATVSSEVLEKVKEGLIGVVHSPEGTARRLAELKIPMGGKTGTAQVVKLETVCKARECQDHAWFVAFAPADKPTIAVAVLVEHGGGGSAVAAPVAGQIIQAYLQGS